MSISSTLSNVGNAIASTTNAINTLDNGLSIFPLDKSLSRVSEIAEDAFSAVVSFTNDNADDWRVRLSLPVSPSFRTSVVMKPLKDAGGLIFPYTPKVTIGPSAKYTAVAPIHSNYQFQAYQNSDPGKIEITAPMNVEDSAQALYWIASLHFLRSMTKMFSGNDPKAGNPPPIVYFNGYGGYVFKNVPVIVTSFTTTLSPDCDYIPVNVSGSLAGAVSNITGAIGGLAGAAGQTISGINDLASNVTNVMGDIGAVSQLLGSYGLGGSVSGGVAYVPTKSEFSVTLYPVYSRNSVRNFSLNTFVTGGYLNNYFGYI